MVFAASLMKDHTKAGDLRSFGSGEAVKTKMVNLAFPEFWQSLLISDIPQLSALYVFGSKKGAEQLGFTQHALGTVRTYLSKGCSGTIIAVDFSGLIRFLAKIGKTADTKTCREFLQGITAEELQQLLDAPVELFIHEVQFGDLVVIPLGYMVCEQTSSIASHGFQMPFVFSSRPALRALQGLIANAPPATSHPQAASGLKLLRDVESKMQACLPQDHVV